MREHEVPTHVQAEDKVLLWFTFPQIVAVVAVCAVAYGAYRYFPFGPGEFRLGVAILLGVVGIAMTVGRVGGRGLLLVCADLLKFKLGARRYAGSPAQLTVGEPPPAPETKPGPLRLLVKRAAGRLGKFRDSRRRRRNRRTFRPQRWFGERRPGNNQGTGNKRPGVNGSRERKPWYRLLAVAGLLALTVLALPAAVLADGPDDQPYGEAWRLDEVYFQLPDPVPGRRVFIERLAVSGNHASVTLRAAHDLDLRVRAYGGRTGRTLRMGANSRFSAGEARSYSLSMDGPSPSFTFSWVDTLGRTSAVSLRSGQIPHPLPKADGGLCGLELASLEWTPGSISGVVASECIAETRQEVDLPVYGGHFRQTVPALLDAGVTAITGTVNVVAGPHRTSAAFSANGETRFSLPVPGERADHRLEITADLAATLDVPLPPMLQTVHHPARTDVQTRRVTCRCGESSTVKTVRIHVHHPEHVRAVEVQRAPVSRTREETVALAQGLGLGTDDPYVSLQVPPPTPEPPRAEQTAVGDSTWWGEPW